MNLLVLAYHYFHREQPSGINKEDFPFSVRLDEFNNHCEALASSGYRLIDPEKIADREQYRGEPDRQVLITIDDGHVSVEDALESILRLKLKPILNIIAGLVGTNDYLGWPVLRHLAVHGFSIQSHSMSHHDLTKLNPTELSAELEQSKKTIEDNIGLPVTMLAAPMGRIDDRVVKTALEAGYEVIMTSFTGINDDRDDFKFLKRFQVKNGYGMNLDDFFNPYSKVRIVGALKNTAKKFRGRFR